MKPGTLAHVGNEGGVSARRATGGGSSVDARPRRGEPAYSEPPLRLYSVRFITTSPSSVFAATLSGTRSASSLSHTVNVRVGRAVSGEKSVRARYDSPTNRIARRLPSAEPMVSGPA